MAAKLFEVNDVLPAGVIHITTVDEPLDSEIKVSFGNDGTNYYIQKDNDDFYLMWKFGTYVPYSYVDVIRGETAFIDLTNVPTEYRTVTSITGMYPHDFFWEEITTGYTITFNSNGGTTISDIEEATELPTTLPTPTKSGYKFVAWYYESSFQTRAKAGDTIEANTTLYAKWHNLGTLFTGIANAIRSKDGTSGNIRDLDFDDRIRGLDTCIYLTQEEYDLLDPPNENITYIIVEVE
jgi:uncharacterized repeat protein (TIGR02543 family)